MINEPAVMGAAGSGIATRLLHHGSGRREGDVLRRRVARAHLRVQWQ